MLIKEAIVLVNIIINFIHTKKNKKLQQCSQMHNAPSPLLRIPTSVVLGFLHITWPQFYRAKKVSCHQLAYPVLVRQFTSFREVDGYYFF